ncbi:hypothetical protein CN150_35870 [Sinorhizobium meliloti]|nr:hypothetical protein CN150_35870 [Sinorhizobium meliloti]
MAARTEFLTVPRAHAIEYTCDTNDIEHRTTKAKHPLTKGGWHRIPRLPLTRATMSAAVSGSRWPERCKREGNLVSSRAWI